MRKQKVRPIHRMLLCSLAAWWSGCHDDAPQDVPTSIAVIAPPIVEKPPVGMLAGAPAVSADGAAVYSLPLEVIPGRAGMQPALALAYASRGGAGIAGVGWNLEATSRIAPCGSALRRDGEHRPVQLAGPDHHCLDGARLIPVGGTEYRVEAQPGTRVVQGGSEDAGWTVYAPDGRTIQYGTSADARVESLVAGEIKRLAWMQNRVEDRLGNYMTYGYGRSSAEAGVEWWLQQIDYAGNDDAGADPNRQVRFEYEPRPATEVSDQYLAGVKIRSTRRLKWITMQMNIDSATTVARVYQLRYQLAPLSRRSRLASVELCDRFSVDGPLDADGRKTRGCMPPTSFRYSDAAVAFDVVPLGASRVRFPDAFNDHGKMLVAGDIDGDGRDDLVYRDTMGQSTPGNDKIAVRRSAGTPLAQPTLLAPEYLTYPEVAKVVTPYQSHPEASSLVGLSMFDGDGDGKVDLLAARESNYCVNPITGAGAPWPCDGIEEIRTRRAAYRHQAANAARDGWPTHLFGPGTGITTPYDSGDDPLDQFVGYADLDGDLRAEVLHMAPWPPEHASLGSAGLIADRLPLQDSPLWLALDRCDGEPMCDASQGIHGGVHPGLAQVVDVDGDGASDVLLPHVVDPDYDNTGVLSYDLLQVRGGVVEAVATNLDLVTYWANDELVPAEMNCSVFVDINGDGLTDLATLAGGAPRVRLNRGRGQFELMGAAPTAAELFWLPCAAQGPDTGFGNPAEPGVRVVDIDQDGRGDLLAVGNGATTRIWRSTGTGFEPMAAPAVFPGNVSSDRTWTVLPLDVNADGLVDVVQVNNSGQLELFVQRSGHADLLTRVDNGLNASTWGVTYAPLTWTSYMTEPFPMVETWCVWCVNQRFRPYVGPMLVVTEERLPDARSSGASPTAGTTLVPARRHTYEQLAGLDELGEGWMGFSAHTVTDLRNGQVQRTRYNRTPRLTLGDKILYPFNGQPIEELSNAPGLAATRVVTAYKTRETIVNGQPLYFTYADKVTRYVYANYTESSKDTSWLRREITTIKVDDFGTQTEIKVDRGGNAVDTTYRENIVNDIDTDTGRWILGLVGRVRVESKQGTAVATRTTTYSYEPGTGRVTEILRDATRAPSDTGPSFVMCTRVTYQPDGFRLPTRVDATPGGCTPNPATTRTVLTGYDADGTYVITTTSPEDHVTTRLIDPGLGVTYQETNHNSHGIDLVTTSQYDGFGRLVHTVGPDGTWTSITRHTVGCAPHALCTTTETSAGGRVSERLDALGQLVRTVKRGHAGDVWTDVEFDDRGRLQASLQPRYTTGASYYAKRYTYDGADRVVSICQHDATRCQRSTYGATFELAVDVYDEDNKRRRTTRDDAGRLATSTIYPDGAATTTTYTYGPFDTLVKVTDAGGNLVTMTYDALGRQRRVDDKDLGWREMDFDAFGQLVTLRDPKAQTATMTYDLLGRLRTRAVPTEGTDEWEWDSAEGAGLGRLARRSRGGVSTRFAYDPLGRTARETWTIDGLEFEYQLAYDGQSRLDTLVYPAVPGGTDRFTIKQGYAASGHLERVQDVSVPAAPRTLWQATASDAHDRVTSESLNGGLRTTTYAYAADTGRLARVTTPGIHDVEYAFAANGTLSSRTDYRNSAVAALATRTESFTYDGANRLRTATVVGRTPATYSYAYDAIGNLTSATDQPSCIDLIYGGTGKGPHQLASARCGGTVYPHQYDANGNETYTRGPDHREQSWTSFDKVLELGSRHGRMRYTYDADHRRVKKTRVPGALTSAPVPETPALNDTLSGVWDTTLYAGDLYERRQISGSTAIEHVFYVRAAGKTIAQVTRRAGSADAWLYYHSELQGTPERFTDGNGVLAGAASYDAWGARRNPDWRSSTATIPAKTRTGYTGHDHDDEVGGLIDMGGRTYDAFFKRFTSPDPNVQDPSYGPSWNRYSYVFNSPTNHTDPTGYITNVAFEQMNQAWYGVDGLIDNMAASGQRFRTLAIQDKKGKVLYFSMGPWATADIEVLEKHLRSRLRAARGGSSSSSPATTRSRGDGAAGAWASAVQVFEQPWTAVGRFVRGDAAPAEGDTARFQHPDAEIPLLETITIKEAKPPPEVDHLANLLDALGYAGKAFTVVDVWRLARVGIALRRNSYMRYLINASTVNRTLDVMHRGRFWKWFDRAGTAVGVASAGVSIVQTVEAVRRGDMIEGTMNALDAASSIAGNIPNPLVKAATIGWDLGRWADDTFGLSDKLAGVNQNKETKAQWCTRMGYRRCR